MIEQRLEVARYQLLMSSRQGNWNVRRGNVSADSSSVQRLGMIYRKYCDVDRKPYHRCE